MSEKERPFIIKMDAPAGEVICDVCNATIASENNIAECTCYNTDWGYYCENCANKYINKNGNEISGFAINAKFKQGEEIKVIHGGEE